MLERYFLRPATIDQVQASWIADAIEQYVAWLTERGYAARNVHSRVPILRHFGEFARARGATTWVQLPPHVGPFVESWLGAREGGRANPEGRRRFANEVRGPIEQMLRLVVPGFAGSGRPHRTQEPFAVQAPAFFAYLRQERGLRDNSLLHYRHHLIRFEAYLLRIGLTELSALSPAVLGAFVAERSRRLGRTSLRNLCGVVRVFLRYLHRERVVPKDLGAAVESPQAYRLATLPRSIPWDAVRQMLECVDRRTAVGKRDYATLFPRVHRVFTHLKTWLWGTHRGVSGQHLPHYLDEFVFRFNRRRTPMAAFQSLLGLTGQHGPTTYNGLRVLSQPDR